MIIIQESRQTNFTEGTWSAPKAGQEVAKAKYFVAKIDALIKEIYGIFGDDRLLDSFDNSKKFIYQLAIEAFIQNTAKAYYPKGERIPTKDSYGIALIIVDKVNSAFGLKIISDIGHDRNSLLQMALYYNGWTR